MADGTFAGIAREHCFMEKRLFLMRKLSSIILEGIHLHPKSPGLWGYNEDSDGTFNICS